MTDERRFADRQPWPAWRRGLVAAARWLDRFLVHPFMMIYPDGTPGGNMVAWSVAAFTVAIVTRLLWPLFAPAGVPLPPLTWPEVVLAIAVLFSLPIHEAAGNVARGKNPEKLLELVRDTVSARMAGASEPPSWSAPAAFTPAPPEGPGTLRADQLQAPITHGRADEEGS